MEEAAPFVLPVRDHLKVVGIQKMSVEGISLENQPLPLAIVTFRRCGLCSRILMVLEKGSSRNKGQVLQIFETDRIDKKTTETYMYMSMAVHCTLVSANAKFLLCEFLGVKCMYESF